MAFALSDLEVTSTAFDRHGKIPQKHTQEGANVSPALSWSNSPEGTKSYAVICHDPDAPLVKAGSYGYVHWVLYDLPGSKTGVEEGTAAGTKGSNDADGTGYTGPMPPEGHGTHHYFFWVLALGENLGLEPGLTLGRFLERAEPHILGMNRLVGTYRR